MKTKIMIRRLTQGLAMMFLMMISVSGYSQTCAGNKLTVSISNIVTTNTSIEYDLYMKNTGTTTLYLASWNQGNVRYSSNITATSVSVVTQPAAAGLTGHSPMSFTAWAPATQQVRWTANPPLGLAGAILLESGVDKFFARVHLNTNNMPNGTQGTLSFPTVGPSTLNQVTTYCNTNTNSSVLTLAASTLVVQGPYNFTVGPTEICATSGLASNLGAVTCFGGADGSATITMSPVPTSTSVSYSVDGGAATAATLTAGAFNVSGLTAGAHSISVTNTGAGTICTTPVVVPVTISGPSGPLTNTTTESACDSYTWAVNGQTYNASGTYTGSTTNGSGCTVAETLVLTINNSTSHTTTTSACDTFTWSGPLGNGQTYTESTTVQNVTTNASGCPHTETLDLTITPSTTNGSLTTSACDSYTWAENGQTYNASGVYTHVVGCNTATLTLTITPSTTNGSLTTSACDSYTWAENGQTYNASGVYTHVVGCNTATLNLTVTPSTTNGSDTVTACGSYTWAENGQTYNASGVYTHVVGCNTATLTLTINTAAQTYYADTDNDGFGAGAPILSCTGQPEGTVTNNTDCAPTDPTKWRTISLYVDADGDGYYNGNPETTSVCYGATIPSGYTDTIIGTDCDDANANANPNHVEIAGNSIDDNCDGNIDETAPLSTIVPSQCGSTLSNIATTIYAVQPATATGYRFEVTNGSNVRTYDSATNSFSLLNLAGGVTYGTTYSIRVAVKTDGFWRSYSATCTITTPTSPATTNVIASLCGTTLSNIANLIYCNQVTAANQYRFEVTNVANTNDVRTFDSAVNRFALTNLVGGAAYGATYSIRVALRFGATWEAYGTACNVSTPATPGITNLVSSQCGVTISSRWTTLYANQVPDAQGYRFEVTNGATTRFYDTTVNRFALGNLVGGATANTVYTVRVAVLYNSVYGAFGPACTVTTSGAFTRQAAPVSVFEVKSYPNPFADTFKLAINTTSESVVELKVYDMIGKLVESRQVNVSEMESVEVGSRYSSGVYNVIVTQGENVETLRVIKR